jgi:hypothetical protein
MWLRMRASVASGWPGERSSQPGRRCSTQRSMSWPTVTPDDGSVRRASTSVTSFASSVSALLAAPPRIRRPDRAEDRLALARERVLGVDDELPGVASPVPHMTSHERGS